MSFALAIEGERWTFYRGPKHDRKEVWDWDYDRDFLPILQRTHGLWKCRNAMRVMGVLPPPFERSPSAVD